VGRRQQFICEAMVSGRFDVGMAAATVTIACRECGTLEDIYVGRAPSTTEDDAAKMTLHCPRSRRHHVTRWTDPGRCPRCGETMTHGDGFARWD